MYNSPLKIFFKKKSFSPSFMTVVYVTITFVTKVQIIYLNSIFHKHKIIVSFIFYGMHKQILKVLYKLYDKKEIN